MRHETRLQKEKKKLHTLMHIHYLPNDDLKYFKYISNNVDYFVQTCSPKNSAKHVEPSFKKKYEESRFTEGNIPAGGII